MRRDHLSPPNSNTHLLLGEGLAELDEDFISEVEDLISVCAGLVTVNEQSQVIGWIDYITQEYFERTWMDWFPDAETDISKICITYLSFDTFEAGFSPTDEEFEARLRLNPLHDYATQNWGHHARAASTEVEQLILKKFSREANMSASSQAMTVSESYPYFDYSQKAPRQLTGVHLTACFGFAEMTSTLLKIGYQSDCKDTSDRTPLSWAAELGHEAVVRLLIERADVEADSKDEDGRTPLSCAAGFGREAVVKLLVERADVEADSKDRHGRTPLSWAAGNGRETVIRLLAERADVKADSKDDNGQTPLSRAAAGGREAVVKLLLAKDGVDPDSKDNDGRTPLSWAAATKQNQFMENSDFEAVVDLLLTDNCVDVDSKDSGGRTPLSWAAGEGNFARMKLLLTKDGIDLDSKDTNGRTPLWWAIKNGHEKGERLFLEKGAIVPENFYRPKTLFLGV